MVQTGTVTRKQRTRQHVIADLSVNNLERFILEAGYSGQRMVSDYGYGFFMVTFDDRGYAEPDLVYFQIKAADSLSSHGDCYHYDVDIRDYNLWKSELMPVILVLFDAKRKKGYWVCIQQYFAESSRHPKKGAKTIRVDVSNKQTISRRGIAAMRTLKQQFSRSAGEREP